MSQAVQFSPLSPEFQANPYPYYEMLRQNAPIYFWEQWGFWFLTRYDDNVAMLKDARLGREIDRIFTREERGLPPEPEESIRALAEMQERWMLLKDPPDHTRLRTLVHKAFTPRMVERLRESAQAITDGIIDQAMAQGGMDLVADLALPLPVTVIADMLGVPKSDHGVFHDWSSQLAGTLELTESQEVYERGSAATVEFAAYLHNLIAKRRSDPREDLISALVATTDEGDKLTEDEMVAMCILLLVAGHETTVNLIGSGTFALLTHPDQWEKLKADPSLAKSAVEELLRFTSPVQLTARTVMEDMEFRGNQFKKGQAVAIMIAAANRDPARFANPAELDITRDPNPHIAFGNGIHFCLGAPLARMEGQIAFTTLARRLPDLRALTDNPPYRDTYVLRGLRELPVAF